MAFYRNWILPTLIDLSMRNKQLVPYRQRVAGGAEGRVLDIGIGSGFNLPFYGPQVGEIFGLDPSPQLLTRARNNAKQTHRNIQLLIGSAECIPLADRSFDTIVLTWVGCSIPAVAAAFGEMRRVLKPVDDCSLSTMAARRIRESRTGRSGSRRYGGAYRAAVTSTERLTS